jgi:hypothetical protein
MVVTNNERSLIRRRPHRVNSQPRLNLYSVALLLLLLLRTNCISIESLPFAVSACKTFKRMKTHVTISRTRALAECQPLCIEKQL